jgi:hypothetical protein
VRTPVGLGQQGSKGGAKIKFRNMAHFQGFSFFEVKLKLIISLSRNDEYPPFLGGI